MQENTGMSSNEVMTYGEGERSLQDLVKQQRALYVGEIEGGSRVYEIDDYTPTRKGKMHSKYIYGVMVNPDGTMSVHDATQGRGMEIHRRYQRRFPTYPSGKKGGNLYGIDRDTQINCTNCLNAGSFNA